MKPFVDAGCKRQPDHSGNCGISSALPIRRRVRHTGYRNALLD
ncbi:hypothetical protein [Burkholderia sp. LMG 13014]|nr:hypothetical protein [Burkholderia sp. LMG 13014]